jgi:hypothetical protein
MAKKRILDLKKSKKAWYKDPVFIAGLITFAIIAAVVSVYGFANGCRI